jgi:hypothetical protein
MSQSRPKTGSKNRSGWKKQKRGLCFADRPLLENNAAGIDIGARELWVAVPPGRDASFRSGSNTPMRARPTSVALTSPVSKTPILSASSFWVLPRAGGETIASCRWRLGMGALGKRGRGERNEREMRNDATQEAVPLRYAHPLEQRRLAVFGEEADAPAAEAIVHPGTDQLAVDRR